MVDSREETAHPGFGRFPICGARGAGRGALPPTLV